MKARIASAISVFLVFACLPVYSQSAPPYGAPQSMRLCVDDCQTLTWNSKSSAYFGVKDGESATSTIYIVHRWDANGIKIYGRSVAPVPGSTFPVTGVFLGKLSPVGGMVIDPEVTWQIGPASGMRPYSLTWVEHTQKCNDVLSAGQNTESDKSDTQRGIEAIQLRRDYQTAACWFQEGASKNNGEPQGLLAFLYYAGLGVPRDYDQAAKWAGDSAFNGNPVGENLLALIYATGHGLKANQTLYRYWLLRARSRPEALRDLSWTPKTLMGATEDMPIADTGAIPTGIRMPDQLRPREEVSAPRNCPSAGAGDLTAEEQWRNSQLAFGAKNIPLSACWAFLAALKGHIDAQLTIAWFFQNGVGVDRSDDATLRWYRKAAEAGSPLAEANMAVICLYQRLEIEESKYWAEKAKAHPAGEALVAGLREDEKNRENDPNAIKTLNKAIMGAFMNFGDDVDAGESAYRKAISNGWSKSDARAASDKAVQENRALRSVRPLTGDEELQSEMADIIRHMN